MLRRIRLLAPFLALLLLISTITPVSAADPVEEPLSTDEAIELLQTYSIVKGDESGNLNLDAKLTRAQAAAIFVRARNMGVFAGAMADSVTFGDAKGHWATGEIAMANHLSLMKGDPSGRFRPDDQITYAEVLTVLLRMIGQEPAGQWDPAVIMRAATEAGIAPDGVSPSDPAVRQETFWALASAMTVPVGSGRSLLGQNFDVVPPTLEMNELASATTEEEAEVSGTAPEAVKVLVDGKAVTLQKNTGKFSATVDLKMGTNFFQVEAYDRAGNRAAVEVSIERRPEISKIEIKGPVTIAPETTQKLEITAYDVDGDEVALQDAVVKLSSSEHAFDLVKKTLTTGEKKGKATLTLTSGKAKGTYSFDVQGPSKVAEELELEPVNDGRALAPDKEYTVTVKVLNDDGRVVTDDYGRKITVSVEDMDDVIVTPSVVETVKGAATFKVRADDEGTMSLKLTSSGLDSIEREIQVLTSPRIVLSTPAKPLSPDGVSTATIKATLMDDNGKTVTNTKSDIEIELEERDTDGYVQSPFLTIPRGKSAASGTATYVAGYEPGTAIITGSVDSSPAYSVQSLEIPVDAPLGGAKFELKVTPENPQPGETATVTLRVTDENGRTDSKASYGFLIKVLASDGDEEDVELKFTNTVYSPVSGLEEDNEYDLHPVVGRTFKGTAEMTLTYPDTGIVKLTPVGVREGDEAYHQLDGFGEAVPTRSYGGEALSVQFANKPATIELVADTGDWEEDEEAVVRPSRAVRLVARVLDRYGDVIDSFSEQVTLTRIAKDRVTSIEESSQVRADEGEAAFEVWVYDGVGSDSYQASIGSLKSNELMITVDN